MWRLQTGFLRRTMVPLIESPIKTLTGRSNMNSVCFQCVGLNRKRNITAVKITVGYFFFFFFNLYHCFVAFKSWRQHYCFFFQKDKLCMHMCQYWVFCDLWMCFYSELGPVLSSTAALPVLRLSKWTVNQAVNPWKTPALSTQKWNCPLISWEMKPQNPFTQYTLGGMDLQFTEGTHLYL